VFQLFQLFQHVSTCFNCQAASDSESVSHVEGIAGGFAHATALQLAILSLQLSHLSPIVTLSLKDGKLLKLFGTCLQ